MNVSWRRRELVGSRWPPLAGRDEWREALEAMLGVSKRVDGKPKRIHVASLGSIDETAIDHPAHRYAFWQAARSRLARLSLAPEAAAAITARLAARVEPSDAAAFVARVPWLELYLVNADAAEACLHELRDGGAIDDHEFLARVEYVASSRYARELHQRYQEALELAHAKRTEARMIALAALRNMPASQVADCARDFRR